jgi:hypothetical protein
MISMVVPLLMAWAGGPDLHHCIPFLGATERPVRAHERIAGQGDCAPTYAAASWRYLGIDLGEPEGSFEIAVNAVSGIQYLQDLLVF